VRKGDIELVKGVTLKKRILKMVKRIVIRRINLEKGWIGNRRFELKGWIPETV